MGFYHVQLNEEEEETEARCRDTPGRGQREKSRWWSCLGGTLPQTHVRRQENPEQERVSGRRDRSAGKVAFPAISVGRADSGTPQRRP